MEGLRGFAVFLVFLVHYATLVQPWIIGNTNLLNFSIALHSIGNAGVDLFFVLSGYLIYGSLIARSQPFLRFIGRRIQRIYPAFTAVFLLYLFLSFVFPAENKIPADLLGGTIYILQNFLLLPGLLPIEPMITVAWSLSYEMFYYLITPVIIGLFGLRKRTSAWRVFFFIIIAAGFSLFCGIFGGPIRLVMFVSGMLLYEIVKNKRISPLSGSFGLVALCVGLLGMLLPVSGSGGYVIKISILFVSFFLLCFSSFRNPAAWLSRSFAWTPLRWLGNMSYSYYLLHGLALKASFLVLTKVLPASVGYGPVFFLMLLPITFGLTLIPTSILFLIIERPFSLAGQKVKRNEHGLQEKTITKVPALSE
jgi:peptidoglycan/LPS O-acetylase OafA/YrhL